MTDKRKVVGIHGYEPQEPSEAVASVTKHSERPAASVRGGCVEGLLVIEFRGDGESSWSWSGTMRTSRMLGMIELVKADWLRKCNL